MKQMMIITVIALVVLVAAPVPAQMRMRGEYGRGPYDVVDISKLPDIDLTQEQAGKLRTLRENNLREIQPYLDQIRFISLELRELWLMREPDRCRIEALQNDILKLRAEIREVNAAYRQSSLKYLTHKQRAIVQSCEEQRGYGYGRGIRGRGGMEGLE
jgi:Spy/CpxP family protein refolding chaperone